MIRKLSYLFAAIFPVVGATGCQLEPFNGQTYASRGTAITFSGCTLNPSDPLEIYACPDGTCATPGGTHLTTVLTPTVITYTDNQSYDWYCASTSLLIPSTLWRSVSGKWKTHVQIFSQLTDPWGQGGTYLSSFDNPASECPAAPGMDALFSSDPKCIGATHPFNGWNAIWANP